MANLSTRLRELRKQARLSQQDLADILKVSKQSISQYERGVRTPDYDFLLTLCDYFNVSSDYLLGKSNVTLRFLSSKELEKLNRKGEPTNAIRIPVLGRVAAGAPIEAVEDVIDYEEIPEKLAKSGEYFALRIKGDSMEPRIANGDVVIVRKQEDAEDGDLVIALINGNDGVCKKLKKYADGIALISTNPAYDPLYFSGSEMNETPVRIIGRVVEARSKY